MNELSTHAQTLQTLWGGFMSSVNLCCHFSFIQENSYSTNAADYTLAAIPNWSCGGDKCLFSSVGQTQPLRLENRFIPGGIEKLAFDLPVGNVIVTSIVPTTFQRVSSFTDEINELARGRRGSRQAASPPLHLHTINKYFNKNTELKNNKTAFSVLWPTTVRQKIRSHFNTFTDNQLSRWLGHLAIKGKRVLIIFLQRKQSYYFSSFFGVKANWRGGEKSVSSQSAVRSRYAWMFEHYQVSTVLLEITVNQRDKGIIDELKTDNGSSKGSLLILKRLMSLLRVAKLKTRGVTTSPSLYHNAGRLFT